MERRNAYHQNSKRKEHGTKFDENRNQNQIDSCSNLNFFNIKFVLIFYFQELVLMSHMKYVINQILK